MKAFNLRNVLFAAVTLGSLALAGCGSSFSCSAKSKCSADPAQSQAAIAACNKLVAGACGSEVKDLGNCEQSNQTCTSSNTTDTAALAKACATQQTALTNCCTKNPTACQ